MQKTSSRYYTIKQIKQFYTDNEEKLNKKVLYLDSLFSDIDIAQTFMIAFHEAHQKAIENKKGEIITSHFDYDDNYSHIIYRHPINGIIEETMVLEKSK